MLEKEIEKKCNEHATATGWIQYKWVSPGKRAVPDRLYFYKATTICIEWKAWGKKASELQKKEHRALRKAGIPVYVIDNVTEGKHLLDVTRALIDNGQIPPLDYQR